MLFMYAVTGAEWRALQLTSRTKRATCNWWCGNCPHGVTVDVTPHDVTMISMPRTTHVVVETMPLRRISRGRSARRSGGPTSTPHNPKHQRRFLPSLLRRKCSNIQKMPCAQTGLIDQWPLIVARVGGLSPQSVGLPFPKFCPQMTHHSLLIWASKTFDGKSRPNA